MVFALLEKLGLTKNEAKLYLLLLDLGSSATGQLIKKSGFQSSVVYHLLGRLQEKGVVSYVQQGSQKIYHAANPAHFRQLLEQQEKELQETKDAFERELPQLEQRRQQTTSNSIHIYKGKQGLKTAFNDILHSATEYCVYGGTGNFTPLVPAYQQFFEQERIKKQIVQRNLFCTSETREDAAHQTTKYLNPDHNLPFSFVVYNDNVLINIFDDTPNVTIKIESPTLANAFTNFFNDLWGRQ